MVSISQWRDHLNSAIIHASSGLFTLHCDNSKRRGVGRSVQHLEIEGAQYSSGHVHLDTQALPVCDYLSMQQMIDQLSEWGNCAIMWHHKEG